MTEKQTDSITYDIDIAHSNDYDDHLDYIGHEKTFSNAVDVLVGNLLVDLNKSLGGHLATPLSSLRKNYLGEVGKENHGSVRVTLEWPRPEDAKKAAGVMKTMQSVFEMGVLGDNIYYASKINGQKIGASTQSLKQEM